MERLSWIIHPGRTNVITRVLISGRESQKRENQRCGVYKRLGLTLLAKKCRQYLEARKGKEIDSPLEPPERMQPC